VRVTPSGAITPCVYWPASSLGIADAVLLGIGVLDSDEFLQDRQVPAAAADCRCQGGCASRRALSGRLDSHDDYCPWIRGDEVDLSFTLAPAKQLTGAKNVCTTIVI